MKTIFQNSLRGVRIVFDDLSSFKIALVASIVVGYIYYWLYSQVSTVQDFIQMTQSGEFGPYSYLFASVYVVVTVLTIILYGISTATLVWLFKNSKLNKLASSSNAVGAVIGAFGSACPVCGAFLLSLFGLGGSLSTLPLMGLELKIVSFVFIALSALYATSKVTQAYDCEECKDITLRKEPYKFRIFDLVLPLLIIMFLTNQFLINSVGATLGLLPKTSVIRLILRPAAKPSYTIVAPKLNPDGVTTSLVEQPTITEVPGNPSTGDHLEDAKVVMFPTGKPFYAPGDISFDDPINAQNKWKAYKTLELNPEQVKRWDKLTGTFTCNYCCGTPGRVTTIRNCGCAHSLAWQGFFKYMIVTYNETYSDEQLLGEAFRWSGLWYPRGVLEDYLLATDHSEALPHTPHGGSGEDGMHGYSGSKKSAITHDNMPEGHTH